MKTLTDGQGTYCTTAQEDTATYNGFDRAARAGLFDFRRIAVLRTGINFDRQYEDGFTAYEAWSYGVLGTGSAFVQATENLYRAGGPLVHDIIENWAKYEGGLPGVAGPGADVETALVPASEGGCASLIIADEACRRDAARMQ